MVMDAVAIETPSGRVHWVLASVAAHFPAVFPAGKDTARVSLPLDDDVAELASAFMHYNTWYPVSVQNTIMHGADARTLLPPWAMDMAEELRALPPVADAIMEQCAFLPALLQFTAFVVFKHK